MADKKSILNTFIESIDWNQPLDALKAQILTHIQTQCKDTFSKKKMAVTVNGIQDLNKLQQYTFNSLLKFEGEGVISPIPR